MAKMSIIIADNTERENLFAELYDDTDEQWAEILQEADSLTIRIFPKQSGDFWTFEVDDVIEIIQKAKRKLLKEI